MVASSYRSVRYFHRQERPPAVSTSSRLRSNCAIPLSNSKGSNCRLCAGASSPGIFSKLNSTWKRGVWPRLRSGFNTSTSFSIGNSWCSYAPSATSRTRARSWRKLGWPDRSMRSTRVLIKRPISASVPVRVRPAMGDPATMSGVPVYRCNRTLNPASKTMNRVAFSCRLRACKRRTRVGGKIKVWRAPLLLGFAGFGRLVGSSRTGSGPLSCSVQ